MRRLLAALGLLVVLLPARAFATCSLASGVSYAVNDQTQDDFWGMLVANANNLTNTARQRIKLTSALTALCQVDVRVYKEAGATGIYHAELWNDALSARVDGSVNSATFDVATLGTSTNPAYTVLSWATATTVASGDYWLVLRSPSAATARLLWSATNVAYPDSGTNAAYQATSDNVSRGNDFIFRLWNDAATPTPTVTSTPGLTATPTPTVAPTASPGPAFYLDAGKTDVANCAWTPATACRTYGYFYASGCDADGCANNVAPGSTIYVAPGTYTGDGAGHAFGVPFDGTAALPVTLQCDGAAGSCVIDGTGVALGNGALLWFGVAVPSGANAASYVQLKGFTVQGVSSTATYLVAIKNSSHHISIEGSTLDCSGAQTCLLADETGESFLTLKRSTVQNCPGRVSGCTYWQGPGNLAVVGNTFGPVVTSGNYDCNTTKDLSVGLIDGNVCHDTADGFDEGMNTPTSPPLTRVIVRYNEVKNATARAFPISGECTSGGCASSSWTGANSLYKNVAHGTLTRGVEAYGGAVLLNLRRNTLVAPGDYGSGVWIQPQFDFVEQDVFVRDNLVLGTGTGASPVVLSKSGSTTIGCPSGHRCPWTHNGFFFSSGGTCVEWTPTDAATDTYGCSIAGINTGFNSASGGTNSALHSGNLYLDPNVVSLAGQATLANLALTASSGAYLDSATPFCTATAAGSGTTIPVTCTGSVTDPRYYFPAPADYYNLTNNDCVATGTRSADGASGGCYALQIAGCGVVTVTGATATTLDFTPSCAGWANGAAVDVPWTGTAGDVGALDAPGATPTPTLTATPTRTLTPTPPIPTPTPPTPTATPNGTCLVFAPKRLDVGSLTQAVATPAQLCVPAS